MTAVRFTRDDVDAVQAGMLALRLLTEAVEELDQGADLSLQRMRVDTLVELHERMRAELRDAVKVIGYYDGKRLERAEAADTWPYAS